YRNASTGIKLSRIQIDGLNASVANTVATLTENGADFDLVALGETDAFVVYEDQWTHRCKAALVHWPDHWSPPIITTPVDVPTTVNNSWCTRPLMARSLGGNRIALSWGINPNASMSTRLVATVATTNTTDDTISFGIPSELYFSVSTQRTPSIGHDLGSQVEIVPKSPSSLIFINRSLSYVMSHSRFGWLARLFAWSSPRGGAVNGANFQIHDCTVDDTVITCDPEQQREVGMALGDVSAVDRGNLLIAPVVIGNEAGVGVREGETSGLKGTALPGWSNEVRFFSILPLSSGKFIVTAKSPAGTSAALGQMGGDDIIWSHFSLMGGKVAIPAGAQDRFLFFNYPDSTQTGGSTALRVAQFAESCPQCGNGVRETGEQCGEPGLICSTGSTCQECQCIAASSSSVVSSHSSVPPVSSATSSSSLSSASLISSSGLLSSSSAGSSFSSLLTSSSSSSSVTISASSSSAYAVTQQCANGILEGTEQCEVEIGCPVGLVCRGCFCEAWSSSLSSALSASSAVSSQAIAQLNCGDGVLDALEQCERGFDYCPPDFLCDYTSCYCLPSFMSPTSSTSSSAVSSAAVESQPLCGNGILEGTEECETGSQCPNGAFCTATCTCQVLVSVPAYSSAASARCGDGRLDAPEQCDSGIPCPNGGLCTGTCTCVARSVLTPLCGNGVLNNREECDDGNETGGDGCDAHCRREETQPAIQCGNDRIEGAEQCERSIPCPGVNYLCRNCQCFALSTPVCGNGTIESDEACETTVPCADPTFICASCRCIPPVCGDGSRSAGEECDDGNAESGDGCSTACLREIPAMVAAQQLCGNGLIEQGEACDDGNTISGDGCTSSCTQELSAAEPMRLSLVIDRPAEPASSVPALIPAPVIAVPPVGPVPKKMPSSVAQAPLRPAAASSLSIVVSAPSPATAMVVQQSPIRYPAFIQSYPAAPASGPIGNTGPASVAVMAAGAAAGLAWMRRKRRD
ncbi:MAG: hypothetical protein Q7S29_05035, partial [Candidatus Peribacter sp.]|nr:hypothetical protein [Candidatus Peribacter sp.]